MTLEVIAAVLLGALLHALWNTLTKRNAARAGDAVVRSEEHTSELQSH